MNAPLEKHKLIKNSNAKETKDTMVKWNEDDLVVPHLKFPFKRNWQERKRKRLKLRNSMFTLYNNMCIIKSVSVIIIYVFHVNGECIQTEISAVLLLAGCPPDDIEILNLFRKILLLLNVGDWHYAVVWKVCGMWYSRGRHIAMQYIDIYTYGGNYMQPRNIE